MKCPFLGLGISPWLLSLPSFSIKSNLDDNRDTVIIAYTYIFLIRLLDVNQMLINIILSEDYTGLLNSVFCVPIQNYSILNGAGAKF